MIAAKQVRMDPLIDKPLPTMNKTRARIFTLKRLGSRVLALCAAVLLLVAAAQAQPPTRATVIFQDGVSTGDVDLFLNAWSLVGVAELMRVPFINGSVLSLPAGVTVSDLASDPLVQNVEDKQPSEILTEALGEGGAGEGGAGEGGANPFITLLENKPSSTERTWGILSAYNELYDPMLYTDDYDKNNVPALLEQAQDNLTSVNVAVFDTGVDETHGKFKISNKEQSVKGGVDLVDFTGGIPFDLNGHGTHIAGTIGGKEFGVAPRVNLYAVRVLDDFAGGDSATLVMGLQWALDNGIDVVNMSLGFRDDNPLVRLAIQNAYNAGLIMVAAVGNHSNWIGNGGSGEGGAGEGGAGEGGAGGGGSTNLYPVMYPAAYPEVIAVAAMDPFLALASFSNDGPEVDLLAAGVNVLSLDLDRGRKATGGDDFYGLASGTSMAAPHVTGAVALMLALANDQGKTLTPAEVETILKDTAYNGILDVMSALEAVAMLP